MNIPQFTAEAALGRPRGSYRAKAVHFIGRGRGIDPQQFSRFGNFLGGDCFGSTEQCIETFCVNVAPGKQKAACFAACGQPSVCSGCSCSCSPDCTRTCLRECTRSTTSGSAILRCRRSCFPFPDGVLAPTSVLTAG